MKKYGLIFTMLLFVLFANGQNKDYHLYFKSGVVSPDENMREMTSLNQFFQDKHLSWDENEYCILQFYNLPGQQVKNKLTAQGVLFENYMPENAFLVSLPSDININILKEAGVRSILPFSSNYKIDPVVAEITTVPDEAWADNNDINISVLYFNNLSVSDFTSDLKAKFGVSPENVNEQYKVFEVAIPYDRLGEFAELPYIKYIQESVTVISLDDKAADAFHGNELLQSPTYNNLQGEGVTVAMSDIGNPIENIDFKGRLNADSYPDNYLQGYDDHGDHTAGIVASAGNYNEIYKGVAPKCNLIVFKGEGATAAADENSEIVITSISMNFGLKTCPYLGRYNNRSRTEDTRINQHPYLLECFSAGNYSSTGCYSEHPRLFGINEGEASAKNTLTVGGLYNVILQGKNMYNNDASKGPVVDRRIKPEIIALGRIVSNINFNEFELKSGSSMSTPEVAGAAALLYELYRNKHNGDNPDAALIKAILCNTAEDCDDGDEAGANPGPDYTTGFGYLNTYRSAQSVDSSWFTSMTLNNSDDQSMTIEVPDNTAKLKVMICWNDPAAVAFAEHTLVNNIDLELYSPNNTLYQPWVLDTTMGHLEDDAVRGVDNINNIEQVTIDNPESGNYTIKVIGTHIPSGPQKVWISYYFVPDVGFKFLTPVSGTSYFPGEEKIKIGYDVNKDIRNTNTYFNLSISYDNGATWQLFSSYFEFLGAQYYWKLNIPTGVQTGKARLKAEFNDYTFLSDTFSIMDIPVNLRAVNSENGTTSLKWDAVPGAVKYEVFKLGDKFMESIGTTTAVTFLANGTDHTQDNYFAVRAYGPDNAISRRSKPLFLPPGEFNLTDETITEFPFIESFEGDYNTMRFGSFYHAEITGGDSYKFKKGTKNSGSIQSGPEEASDRLYYAYVDNSGKNKYFCLESPVLDFTNLDNPRLTFDYNMYGSTMGTLYVLISDDDGVSWDTIFQKSGDQGKDWYKQRISLQQYQANTVKIRFLGLSGNGGYTEMAIDNVIVENQKELEADFYTFKRNIITGDTVRFHNLSTENSDNWIWVFEGATTDTSYEQNPSAIYNAPGIYRVELTAKGQNAADTKLKIGYVIVKDPDAYCLPPENNSQLYEWAKKVEFEEQSFCFGTDYYYNLSDNKLYIHRGVNQMTIVKANLEGIVKLYRAIWMDLNNDGDFKDDGEMIYSGLGVEDDTIPNDFTIPYDMDYNIVRMRLGVRHATIPPAIDCVQYWEMGLYDFTVVIDTVPAADFTADITEIDAGESILFTDASTSNAVTWLWDFENSGTHYYSTAKNPAMTFNDPGTYTVKLTVSNHYGSNTETKTDYITVTSTSPCSVSSFPWNEDFEHGGTIPDCWTDEHVTDNQDWEFRTGSSTNQPGNAHSGTYNASLYNNSSAANVTKLVTPELNLDNVTNPILIFWHTQRYWQPDQDYLKLYYKVHADSNWVLIKEWTNNVPDWKKEEISLPNKSAHYYLGFEGWAKYGYGLCIDDVKVEGGSNDPPDCTTPVSPTDGADDVDIGTNLEWESVSSVLGYKLYLGTNNPPDNMVNGSDLGNLNVYDPTDNFERETAYYWKIVPYNGNGEASGCQIWTFTTSDGCEYCETSYGNTADDHISKVVFNQINKESGSTNYSDFTSISTDAEKEQTYTLSVDVTVNGTWTQKVKAWFDWNNNCDFTDDGEGYSIGETPRQKGTFTISKDIIIPNSAENGQIRMRVAEKYNREPTSCEQTTYGEAEDYSINITGGSREITGLPETTIDKCAVRIFPNPVNDDIVYVESNKRINRIYVYNLNGMLVQTILDEQKTKVELNVSKLPAGLYFVKIITDKQIETQKLIRE